MCSILCERFEDTYCLNIWHIFVRGGGGTTWADTERGQGFLSNTGAEPLKNHKATKPAFNVGPLLACQETQWCFTAGPMMDRL